MSNIYRLSNNQSKAQKVIQVKPVQQHETDYETSTIENHEHQIKELKKRAEQELKDAKMQAEQILTEAKQKVEQEYKTLEDRSQQVLHESKEMGFQEGFQEGKHSAEVEYQDLINQAQELIHQTRIDYEEKLKSAESNILKLSLSSAEKILKKKLDEDQSIYLEIIKNNLEEVIHQPQVTLNVHPKQYKFLNEHKEELEELFPKRDVLTIFPNKDLTENSCLIESPYGMVDSSIDTQLNQLKLHLTDFIKEEN